METGTRSVANENDTRDLGLIDLAVAIYVNERGARRARPKYTATIPRLNQNQDTLCPLCPRDPLK